MWDAPTFRLDPPRLRTVADPGEERHATWFELYFDLVFVVAVGELAVALTREPSAATFARFIGLFVVIAWAWSGYTFYANRFDTDDLPYRLAKSGAMLAIAAVAINVHLVMKGQGGTVGFAVGYVVVRSLLVSLYVRARLHVRGPGRALINTYIVGFSLTTGLWLLSIFLPEPFRLLLWGIAIGIDLTIPTRAWKALAGAPIVVSHLTERFGTFFIIVLGAAVAGAVTGRNRLRLHVASWAAAAACFVIALILWWIYFDLADTSVVGRGALGLVYTYGHLPLLAGVAAFGAGTKLAITGAAVPASTPAPAGRSPAASRRLRFLSRSFISARSGPLSETARCSAACCSRPLRLSWRQQVEQSPRWLSSASSWPQGSPSCCSRHRPYPKAPRVYGNRPSRQATPPIGPAGLSHCHRPGIVRRSGRVSLSTHKRPSRGQAARSGSDYRYWTRRVSLPPADSRAADDLTQLESVTAQSCSSAPDEWRADKKLVLGLM